MNSVLPPVAKLKKAEKEAEAEGRHREEECCGLTNTLDNVMVHNDIAQNLKKLVTEQDCPHLLFYGPSGAGKKALIMALLRQMFGPGAEKRLLATLRDHFGSINCVRWVKHGRYIASGSDDQVILIHERNSGSSTMEFGSGEPLDIENWKVAMTLRGHTADVMDLNWSPDDSTLASGSLDKTIHIWNMSNGICTAVLRSHSSLVKGVAWDPIGSFIESQSDDKTVIIWKTSDWSLPHRTDGHWANSAFHTDKETGENIDHFKCLRPPYGVVYLAPTKKQYVGFSNGVRQLRSLVLDFKLTGFVERTGGSLLHFPSHV